MPNRSDSKIDRPLGRAAKARKAKPAVEAIAAVGEMCEPLLKSHRVEGNDREAGCDWRMGTSKRESAAMPPAATRDVAMLAV